MELADALRDDLKRRCTRKGLKVEDLVCGDVTAQFPGLPPRSRTWIYRALQPGTKLPVIHAIELAIRARHKGMRLADTILAKLERAIVPPEPAVVVLPGESAAFAAFVCDLVHGKSRKQAETALRKAFERFENANTLAPIRETINQLAATLAGSNGALSIRHSESTSAADRMRATLALLRDGGAIDDVSFRVPSPLAKLARFRDAKISNSKAVRK